MKLTLVQHELVATYIKGELNEESLANFEATLAGNTALQEEVLFQKSILSSLRLDIPENAMKRARMDNLLEDKTQHPQFEFIQNKMQQARIFNANRQRQIRRWLLGGLVAACVLLFSVVGLQVYLDGQLDSDIGEIANSIDLEAMSLTIDGLKPVSGRPDFIKYKLEEAQTAFDNKDWNTALAVFEQLSYQSRYESTAMDFSKGIIFYHKKEYEKSIEQLESIDLNKAASACKIRYFLALSYLKNKKKNKAKEQYETLTTNSQNCNEQSVKHLKKYFIL